MKNILKFAIIPIGCISVLSTSIIMTSCSSNKKIVFANFSGYMNPNVQRTIKKKYSVQWDEYESNESIPTFLRNGTYDLAVATQYKIVELARSSYQSIINKNKEYEAIIRPIDWNKFELGDLITQDPNTKLFNFKKLKSYFTTQTWNILTAYNLNGDNTFDENCKDNLLNWTIPYFAQTLSFGYRGPLIKELQGENITFKKIFDYFKNPNAKESMFKGKKTVSLIKDERTDYDLSKMLVDEPIFIENNAKISTIDKLINDYKPLDEAMKVALKQINLENDSNTILNQLSLNQISGAITYNGDLVYASNGGDYLPQLKAKSDLPNKNNFHVVTPKNTLICFDGIVFSNKLNDSMVNSAYNIVKDIAIPTQNRKLINNCNIINNCFPLDEKTENSNINYLILMNFDYVYYNAVWKCFYEAIQLQNSNLANSWQKPFFSNIDVVKSNNVISKTIDGYYKNIEYPTNSKVSSNLNIVNITFVNESVR